MIDKQRFTITAGAFAMLCLFTSAYGQGDRGSGWSVTPYIWGPDTSVDLKVGGAGFGGTTTFDDLLDVLDTAFMIHVEGGSGNWSGFGDITLLETSETSPLVPNLLPDVSIESKSDQAMIDLAFAYWPGGVDTPLSFFGGLRYTDFDDRYRLLAGGVEIASTRSSTDYTDLLVGIRYRFDVSERWAVLTRGDVSLGDTEGTYLLRANLAYSVGSNRQNRLLFGYQYKEAEFKESQIRSKFSYSGPMVGFNFRF